MHQHFKTKLTIGSTLLAITLAGTVYANPPAPPKDGDHCKEFSKKELPNVLPPFLRGIELSNEQKTQISVLANQEHAQIEAQHQQRGALMKELHQLSNATTFNEQQAQTIANQLADLEKAAFLNRARNGHKILSLLTAEQRKKANENIQKHMEKTDGLKPVNATHLHQKLSFKINS